MNVPYSLARRRSKVQRKFIKTAYPRQPKLIWSGSEVNYHIILYVKNFVCIYSIQNWKNGPLLSRRSNHYITLCIPARHRLLHVYFQIVTWSVVEIQIHLLTHIPGTLYRQRHRFCWNRKQSLISIFVFNIERLCWKTPPILFACNPQHEVADRASLIAETTEKAHLTSIEVLMLKH